MNNKNTRRLAIIPARGGSVRIKNKNIKLFCGKPIISYSIDSAKKSNLFKKIHVSTDSSKISRVVKNSNLKIDFFRPKLLSNNSTGLFKVCKFVYEKYLSLGEVYDEIWCILPCTPLINKDDLLAASKFLNKNKIKKPLMAISKFRTPIEWALTKLNNKKVKPLNFKNLLIRAQDLKEKYYDAGLFYVFTSKCFKKFDETTVTKNFFGFQISINKAVDIDTMEDWNLAELIYKGMKLIKN
jgi:pseudaminic acid cytidylyltransferase